MKPADEPIVARIEFGIDGDAMLAGVISGQPAAQLVQSLGVGIALGQRQGPGHSFDNPGGRRCAGLADFEMTNDPARRLHGLGTLQDFHGMERHQAIGRSLGHELSSLHHAHLPAT